MSYVPTLPQLSACSKENLVEALRVLAACGKRYRG